VYNRQFSTKPLMGDVCRPRDDSSVDMSDHEEEFYYTEVEENVDTVMRTFDDVQTTSPTGMTFVQQWHDASAVPDHDYQRKVRFYCNFTHAQYIG